MVSSLITGVNEGKEPEFRLSDAFPLGSAALLGLSVTGSQAQKPTCALSSMTGTTQLTAAACTHKTKSTATYTVEVTLSYILPTQVINFLVLNNVYSSVTDTHYVHYSD